MRRKSRDLTYADKKSATGVLKLTVFGSIERQIGEKEMTSMKVTDFMSQLTVS